MSFDTFIKIKDKCDKKSQEYRQRGNAFCGLSHNFMGIAYYNIAIAYAESKKELSMAFGNRSNAFLSTEKYNQCLESIKMARKIMFPDKLAHLNDNVRKSNAGLKISRENPENNPWNYLKLSYPANNKIPWIIEGLEMRRTEKYGRGIYSTRDLMPGDIICVEEIKATFIMTELSFNKLCANCLKTEMLNLIPCTKSASFMFCSEECLNQFHTHAEVNLIFKSNEFDSFKHLLSKIEFAFGGREKLKEYLKKPKDESFFDFDYSRVNSSNQELITYKCLMNSVSSINCPLKSSLFCNDDEDTKQLLQKLFKICMCNGINYPCINELGDNSLIPKANVVFSKFFGLVNFSCVPNVASLCVDNKIICYVKQPIKANDQLFFAPYGEFYNNNYLRSKILEGQGITCDCIACKENQSILNREFNNENLLKKIEAKDIKNLKEADKMLKEYCEKLKKYKFNSIESYIIEENINFILRSIAVNAQFPV
ncbi:hypothetical protein PVAND_012919 [Polypedilum vanderplanki]|uniref:SET domain-containing protein n=1 Tax=Polypedilum vanderplanki TaxID=319348 RepID=A0A9J6CNW9_POLVA|nr:hypothetical protein PVAND_012919 [Polypedilum vanderplanki]